MAPESVKERRMPADAFMAIAMVSNALDPPPDEGIKKSAQELAAALERKGATVYRVDGEESVGVRKLLLSSRMLRALRSSKVGAVIYLPTQSATVGSLVRSKVLRSLATTKVALISLQPRELKPLPGPLMRWLSPDLLLTPDPAMLEAARSRGLNAAFLQVGVDHDRFAPVGAERKLALRRKHALPPDSVIALHVGHARWERGLTWLVDLGTGVVPVVAISRSLGVDQAVVRWLRHSSVHLIDTYLPDIQELYQLADVYVFPVRSKHSASAAPLSVLEAMACNLPVVSTPFGALPHMVSERAGLFFAEDQPRFRSAVATASALSPGQVRTRQQVLRYDWAAAADTVFASALTLCRRT
jgi:hypothetical protein